MKSIAKVITYVSFMLLISCHFMGENKPEGHSGATATQPAMEEPFLVTLVPGLPMAAEAYYSPDGQRLICNARVASDDSVHHTYVATLDGTEIIRTNDRGEDACSFFTSDGKRVIYTSTKDNLDLPKGQWSVPSDYPRGAELYIADYDGSNEIRLTHNQYYDAEVSMSPNGKWILFSRQINGEVDLWRMRPDGSDEQQITHTPDWQEGGAFYMPDNETILYRAWEKKYDDQRGIPMSIFTIKHDGTDLKRITFDDGTNWAPYPHPDGKHFVFVKVLPPHNFELFLMNLETGEQTRLTYNEAFDGFPAVSPDGKSVMFSSSRLAKPGERALQLFIMDVSSLFE
ncbi:MAG: TolB family protein [Fidelibacterota bacterium]